MSLAIALLTAEKSTAPLPKTALKAPIFKSPTPTREGTQLLVCLLNFNRKI